MGDTKLSTSDFGWVVVVVVWVGAWGAAFTNDRAGAKKFQRKGVSLRF